MEQSPIDILVLGATGFVGRLVTRYLSTHPQKSSFTFAIAGRSKAKLDALVKELSLDTERVPVILVDVAEPDEIEAAVKLVKVVINAAGPYWKWGTPVVRACVRHGKHHVDVTGEACWIEELIQEFDYVATKANSMIINSCGFDSLIPDLAVYLSSKTLKEITGTEAEIDTSTTAYKIKGGVSGGSVSTMLMHMDDVPKEKLISSNKDHALSPVKGPLQPTPRALYQLPHVKPPIYGSYFVMSPVNKAIVQRTWGLLHQQHLIDPSNAEKRRQAYGKNFKYDEFVQMPNVLTAVALTLSIWVTALGLAFLPPLRWVFRKLLPQPGSGPTEESMNAGFITATNVTTSVASPSAPTIHVKTIVHGRGDPGYSLTAVMISECALAIVFDHDSLPELGRKGGVLTPMSALGDVLVRRLEGTGSFRFESGLLE